MSFKVTCPFCNAELEADDCYLGTDNPCPNCNKTFTFTPLESTNTPPHTQDASLESFVQNDEELKQKDNVSASTLTSESGDDSIPPSSVPTSMQRVNSPDNQTNTDSSNVSLSEQLKQKGKKLKLKHNVPASSPVSRAGGNVSIPSSEPTARQGGVFSNPAATPLTAPAATPLNASPATPLNAPPAAFSPGGVSNTDPYEVSPRRLVFDGYVIQKSVDEDIEVLSMIDCFLRILDRMRKVTIFLTTMLLILASVGTIILVWTSEMDESQKSLITFFVILGCLLLGGLNILIINWFFRIYRALILFFKGLYRNILLSRVYLGDGK